MKRHRSDEGATELFVLVCVMAMLVALGLVVDGGGYMRAQDGAAWCAHQAARAGGQRLDMDAAQSNGTVSSGQEAAEAAAQVVSASGMTGSTTIGADGSVTVECTTTYTTVVLGLVGLGTLPVAEQATARPVRGISQADQ